MAGSMPPSARHGSPRPRPSIGATRVADPVAALQERLGKITAKAKASRAAGPKQGRKAAAAAKKRAGPAPAAPKPKAASSLAPAAKRKAGAAAKAAPPMPKGNVKGERKAAPPAKAKRASPDDPTTLARGAYTSRFYDQAARVAEATSYPQAKAKRFAQAAYKKAAEKWDAVNGV